MNVEMKREIGLRLRQKRESAGYTREQLGELCSLSPRFIANVEFGTSTFSLDSLMTICRILSCSSDYILFGDRVDTGAWSGTIEKIQQLDIRYQECTGVLRMGCGGLGGKAPLAAPKLQPEQPRTGHLFPPGAPHLHRVLDPQRRTDLHPCFQVLFLSHPHGILISLYNFKNQYTINYCKEQENRL